MSFSVDSDLRRRKCSDGSVAMSQVETRIEAPKSITAKIAAMRCQSSIPAGLRQQRADGRNGSRRDPSHPYAPLFHLVDCGDCCFVRWLLRPVYASPIEQNCQGDKNQKYCERSDGCVSHEAQSHNLHRVSRHRATICRRAWGTGVWHSRRDRDDAQRTAGTAHDL